MNSQPPAQDGIFERRFAAKGSMIVHQSDMGKEAFLLQSGSVRVYAEDPNNMRVDLGVLGPGQIFGEMALIVGGLRSASVEAVEDCTLIVITAETLNAKLKKSDPTIRAITAMLMQRLQQGNNTLLGKAGSIEEMLDLVRNIYANLYTSLPATKKQSLENLVRPHLESLLQSIKTFQERHKADKG